MKSLSSIQPVAYALLRIVSGFLFFYHGGQKLFGGHATIHDPRVLVSGIIEFSGGLLILSGFFTRPAALLACARTAVIDFNTHQLRGSFPLPNHTQLPVFSTFPF